LRHKYSLSIKFDCPFLLPKVNGSSVCVMQL
jgi:hypothetical protein